VKREKEKIPRESGKRGRKNLPSGVGIWQIISVVAVLALLGYLVYEQIRGDKTGTQGPAETGMPQEAAAPAAGIGLQSVDLKPLEDAVRDHPADAAAQLRLANAFNDNQRLPQAIEAYRKYLAMRPKDPDARTDFAICFFKQAQSDSLHREALLLEAAREMEEAFNSAPGPHQPSAFNLGIVYLHLNDLDRSNTWFRKAMEINPESDLGKRAQNMITQHTVPQ
jgi:tetratricopeptide (TPR) repeat protein